jgi:ubiquinone/menaquinone biosynthesis C-methylase UbiE
MPARSTYDEVADAYGRVLDPDGVGLDDPVLAELLGDVTRQNVLSLACGQGQDSRLLARLGARVTGVDLSTEMLRYARGHEAANPQGITYVQGDGQDLAEFADTSFDGVLCHMALMDIPHLRPTIQSVARVLRDGGWFVFSIVHPAYHPHVQILSDYLLEHRYAKQRPIDWLPKHAYHRPLSAYINELAQAGLRLDRLAEAHQRAANDAVANRGDRDAGEVPGLLYARAAKPGGASRSGRA